MVSSDSKLLIYKIAGSFGIIIALIGIFILYKNSKKTHEELIDTKTAFHYIIIFIGICMGIICTSKVTSRSGGAGKCPDPHECNPSQGSCIDSKCVCNPGLTNCTEYCYCDS